MAGARITPEEVSHALAEIEKAGFTITTIGTPRLSRLLGVTRIRAQNLLERLRHPDKRSHELAPVQMAPDVRVTFASSQQLRALLAKSKRTWSVEELCDRFNVGPRFLRGLLDELRAAHVNVHVSDNGAMIADEIPASEPTRIDTARFKGREIAFGLLADNHYGSKYARLDVVEALFDIWEQQGVTTVYQCGNIIDGEARFNKFDLVAFGIEGQLDYLIEHWPVRKGMLTKFVTGDDHEGWYVQREQVDIGRMMQDCAERAGRNDLVYLGHMEHDIVLAAERGQSIMRLIHGGGGSAYATSYAPQKIVESYQGGEKPQILLVGHYHKAEYGYPREVHVVQAGTTCDQTPFMRKKKIQAHVGGWTVRFTQAPDGLIHGFSVQWHPFYDKGFYEQAWKYHWTGRTMAPARKKAA